MHTLIFSNEDGHRESLSICGPRCVAEWHASKLRKQRVTRFVQIVPGALGEALELAKDLSRKLKEKL